MSRILITGMSAPQMSVSANKRALTFAGAIQKILTEAKHEVSMLEPRVTWTYDELNQYDAVLVGFSPITSLSANKAYGALHVIETLYETEKIRLFIDAPNPAQITASLRALSINPNNLVKPFYSYRKEYSAAAQPETSQRLINVINRLLNEKWPTTLYPLLPWNDILQVSSQLPVQVEDSLNGVNFDAYLFSATPPAQYARTLRWVCDYPASSWTKKIMPTTLYPAMPMKLHKGFTDEQVQEQISSAIGALISPQKGGTWWSYRYVQAMNTGTPIATEWKESSKIGSSWNVLASGIEAMSQQDRYELSWSQTSEYMSNIPSKKDVKNKLEDLIGLHTLAGRN